MSMLCQCYVNVIIDLQITSLIFILNCTSQKLNLNFHIQFIALMNENNQLICKKHSFPLVFVCSKENCTDNRFICQQCKNSDTIHFSVHANYIYNIKEIYEFDNNKMVIQKFQKGIHDCETNVTVHKKTYQKQISAIHQDFQEIRQLFARKTNEFENVYIEQFNKQMNKFDERITAIKSMLREFVKEKQDGESFFSMLLFSKEKNSNKSLNEILQKNKTAFELRSNIIDLKSDIAIMKSSSPRYKMNSNDDSKYTELKLSFQEFIGNFYNEFQNFLTIQGKNKNNTLKESIVCETKSLAGSRINLTNSSFSPTKTLAKSMVGGITLQKAPLPELHPTVNQVLKSIRPLATPKIQKRDQGPYRYPGGVYFGNYQNKTRHGRGIFVFDDGSYYQGDWRNDSMSGYGRLIKPNCFYQGHILNGKANGTGTYEDAQRTYFGQWQDDKRNGQGQQQFKNGKNKKYIGSFVNDKYDGFGKLFNDQYTYEGNFKNGLFHGEKSTIIYKNGQRFTGYFHQGNKHFGRHIFIDGSYYEGQFKNNLPNGSGDFFWTDGITYSGEWKDSLQDGIGLMIMPDGKKMTGVWQNGNWIKWK